MPRLAPSFFLPTHFRTPPRPRRRFPPDRTAQLIPVHRPDAHECVRRYGQSHPRASHSMGPVVESSGLCSVGRTVPARTDESAPACIALPSGSAAPTPAPVPGYPIPPSHSFFPIAPPLWDCIDGPAAPQSLGGDVVRRPAAPLLFHRPHFPDNLLRPNLAGQPNLRSTYHRGAEGAAG